MKKCLLWMALLVVVGATLQTCKNDSDPVALQKIQFTFALPSTAPSGGRTQGTEPTALLLSLENSLGDPVFINKKITLLHLGPTIMTSPLELPIGTYTITDFLLVDDAENVLFATPKVGSPLAGAVTHPLPYNFTVTQDDVVTVVMEVVEVLDHSPEDFGYASFHVTTVNTVKIVVFIPSAGDSVVTTANATISLDNTVMGNFPLEAQTNIVSFPGNPDASYHLTVEKADYGTYVRDFSFNDLLASLNGSPLKIILHQFSFTASADAVAANSISFFTDGFAGRSIDVHWGDGNTDHLTYGTDNGTLFHQYATSGKYEVVITGAIDSLMEFTAIGDQARFDAIDLQALPRLRYFGIGRGQGPATIDLSQNTVIVGIYLSGTPQIKHVLLPEQMDYLQYVSIDGPNQISTTEVDAIIDKIYKRVQLWGIYGSLSLNKNWASPDGEMVGPPSAAAIEKLKELRDRYLWQVFPDPGPE